MSQRPYSHTDLLPLDFPLPSISFIDYKIANRLDLAVLKSTIQEKISPAIARRTNLQSTSFSLHL